jgi:hypothetical protein
MLQDGRLIAAAAEESFSRRKHDGRLPISAVVLSKVLEWAEAAFEVRSRRWRNPWSLRRSPAGFDHSFVT